MTQTKSKKQIIFEELSQFAQLLKDNGFTVLVSRTHPFEWLHYEKNGRFGTVQPNGFYAYNFGTDNKPCKEFGTGFSTDRDTSLTIENAIASLSNPYRAHHSNKVQSYKDVTDFINSTCNKWADYYTL